MTALTFEALAGRLAVPSDTLILMHRNPDGDAVGTAFALRELLGALGSRAWCVCEGELPARLRFLAAPVQESVLLQSVRLMRTRRALSRWTLPPLPSWAGCGNALRGTPTA